MIPKLLPFCCGKGLENRKTCRSGLGLEKEEHGSRKSCLLPSIHVLFQSIISLSDHHYPEALGWDRACWKVFTLLGSVPWGLEDEVLIPVLSMNCLFDFGKLLVNFSETLGFFFGRWRETWAKLILNFFLKVTLGIWWGRITQGYFSDHSQRPIFI